MDRVIDVTTARRQLQGMDISSRQRALLEELHSLPTLTMDQNPVAVLRTLRKQKQCRYPSIFNG
jgi:hypothetical protein